MPLATSTKRKRSKSSAFESGRLHSPLPVPLTTRPLGPRADSPASSMSSRSSRGKRRRVKEEVDAMEVEDNLVEDSHPTAGPSEFQHEVIDLSSSALKLEDEDVDIPLATLSKKGKGKERADLPPPYSVKDAEEDEELKAGPSNKINDATQDPPRAPDLLSSNTCPICFSTITNACLTPCGHVLCGSCLFASVKSGIQRALDMHVPIGGEGTSARCPVCRAVIKDWNGSGGGIIPLKIRTVMAL